MRIVSETFGATLSEIFEFQGSQKKDFPGGSVVKNPSATAKDTGDLDLVPSQEDPLEEEMSPHCWKII